MVASGSDSYCAISATGRLKCWGKQILDEDSEVNDIDMVRDVGVGWGHLCIMIVSGKVYCYGLNNSGQCDIKEKDN